jgi:hypothetical protein
VLVIRVLAVRAATLESRVDSYFAHTLDQWYSTGGTGRHLRGYVDYTIRITCIMYQQLWGYKVEEKLYLGVREQKRDEYH